MHSTVLTWEQTQNQTCDVYINLYVEDTVKGLFSYATDVNISLLDHVICCTGKEEDSCITTRRCLRSPHGDKKKCQTKQTELNYYLVDLKLKQRITSGQFNGGMHKTQRANNKLLTHEDT